MAKLQLRKFRKQSGMSQAEVASMLGCTQTAYSNYELEKRPISASTLASLSAIFGCSVDELLGYEKPMGVTEEYTLDIADLTFEQRSVITDMVDMYRSKNSCTH